MADEGHNLKVCASPDPDDKFPWEGVRRAKFVWLNEIDTPTGAFRDSLLQTHRHTAHSNRFDFWSDTGSHYRSYEYAGEILGRPV